MAVEFINLDEQDIMPDYPRSISETIPKTKVISELVNDIEVEGICAIDGIYTIDKVVPDVEPEEIDDSICIKEDCDASQYYGCTDDEGRFLKDNLFSELTDEYQRTLARMNLGIAEDYALKWGNITGNLSNQKDLYTFVTESIAEDLNKLIEEINIKLQQWATDIDIKLRNKADIFSPNFTGLPTTTLPLLTDNSNRLASTEWVNAKIEAAVIDDNVKAIAIEPEYMCYGDAPTDVKITWEYRNPVEKQSINGIELNASIREYTFKKQTTSMVITLRYSYGDIDALRIITFDIKYPIYYGTSSDVTQLLRTVSNSFEIDAKADDYMYVMIPNGINAQLAVSSVIGGFKFTGIQEVFNNIYYVFKSINKGLGKTTIEVINQGNFTTESYDFNTIKELLASKADKYTTYTKQEVDTIIDNVEIGLLPGLNNKVDKIPGKQLSTEDFTTLLKKKLDGLYNYDDSVLRTAMGDVLHILPSKADKSEIPSIIGLAKTSDIPTKVSQLANDSKYLTAIPDAYITEEELISKNYITSFTETDPTVPSWAKQATKPSYTADEVGADIVGSAYAAQQYAVEYINNILRPVFEGSPTNMRTFKSVSDKFQLVDSNISNINTALSNKANRSELFSGNYNDLSNKPSIPSIAGLASETYVNDAISNIPKTDLTKYALKTEIPDISNKVDKVEGKQLSEQDYTLDEKEKLQSLYNYNDSSVLTSIRELQAATQALDTIIPYDLYKLDSISKYDDYFVTADDAKVFIQKLIVAKVVTIESGPNDSLIVSNKTASDTTDINGIRDVEILLITYDKLNSIELNFHMIVNNNVVTLTYNKQTTSLIVNNLTTSDTSSALSALQGKILMDKITELDTAIKSITTRDAIILE